VLQAPHCYGNSRAIWCGILQVALGTNPLTLMAPGKEDNFELDMATSAVAIGKVIIYIFAAYISIVLHRVQKKVSALFWV